MKSLLTCNETFAVVSFAYNLHLTASPPFSEITWAKLPTLSNLIKKSLADMLEARIAGIWLASGKSGRAEAKQWVQEVFKRLKEYAWARAKEAQAERAKKVHQKVLEDYPGVTVDVLPERSADTNNKQLQP